jgi:hypothetical protein
VSAVAADVCPEKKVSFEDSLSAHMCAKTHAELVEHLFEQLKLQEKSFATYSI